MNYPHTKNHFRVEWGGTNVGFMEVSGLAIELDVVSYREGSSPESSERLMPGLKKYSPIVLKRGIVKSDDDFYKWINTAQFNKIERRDVIISLLNEQHEPVVTWKLRNAFPSKLEYSTLNAHSSEVIIESLTLVHEGLIVEYL
ncbi:MAG: phage tail protein [Ignavibacteriaceae bacterium]|nr:phage tail protein [Ignavibacteriaceae bacterium]